jgi:hypothetical protein
MCHCLGPNRLNPGHLIAGVCLMYLEVPHVLTCPPC